MNGFIFIFRFANGPIKPRVAYLLERVAYILEQAAYLLELPVNVGHGVANLIIESDFSYKARRGTFLKTN